MSSALLEDGNIQSKNGTRRDIIKILLCELKQLRTENSEMLNKSREIQRRLEETKNFLMAIDNWENKVLDSFFVIRRCILKKHDESESKIKKLKDILKKMRNFEVDVPEKIRINRVEEAYDQPSKGAISEIGEPSNSVVKELKEQNSPGVNNNPNEGVSDLPPKSTTSEVEEPTNIDQQKDDGRVKYDEYFNEVEGVQRDCLCSLAIFPKNTELKRRLLKYWWIGLGLSSLENEKDNQSVEKFFSQLEEKNILKPKQRKEHNQAVDSYTIHPAFYSYLISKFQPNVRNGVARLQPDMDRMINILLNLNLKHLNSGYIGEIIPTIKVVQLGKWHYPDHEVHNKTETTNNDCIDVSGTKFLENIGETVRYLSLRGISKIEELPQSFGKKKSLNVLDLKDCHSLQKLPQKPKSMIRAAICIDNKWFKKLTHLDITGCYLLDYMPKWILELSNLQVLKGAVFNGNMLDKSRLKDISNLQKLTKLSIKIINPDSIPPEDYIGLKSLSSVRVLTIVWRIQEKETKKQCRDNVKDSSEDQEIVKYNISFPENLEKLDMRCYPNAKAPELLSASNLKKLKRLYIRGGKLAEISDDAGRQVEILRLRFLNFLDIDWYKLGHKFTELRCVEYEGCPRLKFFPRNSGCWSKESDKPLPSHKGPFNDDEPIPPQNSDPSKSNDHNISLPSSDPKKVNLNIGRYFSVSQRFKRAILELTSSEISSKEGPQWDLVMVLDIRRSMEGEKLEMMKFFIKSFIEELTRFPVIRLSIVTFGTEAKGQCGLRLVTKNYQREFTDLINSFRVDGSTNASDGLRMGLEVLKDRRFSIGRNTGIMLVSGSNNIDDDPSIPINDISVHTVGIGQDYNKMVLESIAAKSRGTFTDVPNTEYLTKALQMCLIRILNLEVQDLTLTITPIEGVSTIEQVETRTYQQSKDNTDGSVSVIFGELYANDVRTACVDLNLDTSKKSTDILQISYSYKFKGNQFKEDCALPMYLASNTTESPDLSDDDLFFLLREVVLNTSMPPLLTQLLDKCLTNEDIENVRKGQNMISVLEKRFDEAIKKKRISEFEYYVGLVLTLDLINKKEYARAKTICYGLETMARPSDHRPTFLLGIINRTMNNAYDLQTMRMIVEEEWEKLKFQEFLKLKNQEWDAPKIIEEYMKLKLLRDRPNHFLIPTMEIA